VLVDRHSLCLVPNELSVAVAGEGMISDLDVNILLFDFPIVFLRKSDLLLSLH
jgi:hypothetical protein